MRFIGVEFEYFACFERRIVPLRPGVQLLVGRNNSGKTALLRGLSALVGLPVGLNVGQFERALAGYARTGGDTPSFDLTLWFAVDEGDGNLFLDGPQTWRGLCEGKDPTLGFRCRVWPEQGMVGLVDGRLVLGTREVPILEEKENVVYRRLFNSELQPTRADRLDVMHDRQGPQKKSWPLYSPAGLMAHLQPLSRVRSIDARRNVRPNLQAQSADVLAPNADNLSQYLLTLQGSNKRKFELIEEHVTKVFPEFESINCRLSETNVSLTLTMRGSVAQVPLTHCGTGVEQMLVLATAILTAEPGTIILIDEPHSYLHPSAEREVISLLLGHTEHWYVVSTHSAVLINSVSPDRIVYLAPGEQGSFKPPEQISTGPILYSLGYKNSDFLLKDRLVFVEGASDAEILPVLLSHTGKLDQSLIDRTGFPITEGSEKVKATAKQTVILRYERLLQQLGRSKIPRIYLRDGDAAPDERTLLEHTKSPGTLEELRVRFLPRTELENYLLIPEAIAEALRKQAVLDGVDPNPIRDDKVQAMLQTLLERNDHEVLPADKMGEPSTQIKGSKVLEAVFAKYGLVYDKRRSGGLVAKLVTLENQSALNELVGLVSDIFA